MGRLLAPLVLGVAMVAALSGVQGTPGAGRLTIDSLLDIRHPSMPVWSPDGTQIAYVWDRGGVQNVWVVSAQGGVPAAARNVTRADAGQIQSLWWTRDGRDLLFARDGKLWRVRADSSAAAEPAWQTETSAGGFAISEDGTQVAFSRNGDIWVRSLTGGREIRVTSDAESSESGPVWSPDGRRLAFSISSSVRRSHGPEFHGGKILFTWTERKALPDVGIVTLSDNKAVRAAATPGSEGSPAWIDSNRLVLQRIDEPYKTREIVVVDTTSGAGTTVHRDVDPRWFGLTYNNADPVPSPDGRWIGFINDPDGWDHVYLVAADGGSPVQLTRGGFEDARIAWSPDSSRIAIETSQDGPPGRKQIGVIDVGGRSTGGKSTPVTSGPGANTQPVWSPDGRRLLYEHTDARNAADWFVTSTVAAPERPVRLTDSMPAVIDRRRLVEPQLVFYPAPDGKRVPASLFVPSGLDRTRKHPAIVWIHGDLVTQNYEGWHIRRDYGVYYSFHQYLLQQGYVVLAPDYRGSIGYGREWRQGVYRDLGGKEYRDVIAGVSYLRSLGFVDMDRVGVWGLSYGGFLTLQAVTMDPMLFRCGVDVAGVTDYGDYLRDPGQPWLTARMGTREDNASQYDQAAPVRRVSRIARPLLVLGGTADTNVPYEQTVRLVDELLKAGKDFEFMMYPGEFHYFHREHVLRDAWRRVDRFFATHLRPQLAGGAAPSQP